MALLTKRILFFGLMLLVNACVYYPHPFYGGGYGGASYYDGGRGNYGGNHSRGDRGHSHGGNGYHDRRYH